VPISSPGPSWAGDGEGVGSLFRAPAEISSAAPADTAIKAAISSTRTGVGISLNLHGTTCAPSCRV
jgi:hypothetical protein